MKLTTCKLCDRRREPEELKLTHQKISLDYAALAASELDSAAGAADPAAKRAHLNQAAVFATLSEQETLPASPPTAL